MSDINKRYTHGFKIHAPNLLKEVTNHGLQDNSGVLFIPMNILRKYLVSIGERCSQINDPILNKLMVEMAIYEVGDPESEIYDPKIIEQVFKTAEEYTNQ